MLSGNNPLDKASADTKLATDPEHGLPHSICRGALALGRAMVKETKFFRKQAAKAERMARSASDPEISQGFLNMAKAFSLSGRCAEG